jgi:hypothetical protein
MATELNRGPVRILAGGTGQVDFTLQNVTADHRGMGIGKDAGEALAIDVACAGFSNPCAIAQQPDRAGEPESRPFAPLGMLRDIEPGKIKRPDSHKLSFPGKPESAFFAEVMK